MGGALDTTRGGNREGVVAIIPARLGSTRFPGKVLAAKTGRPLIQHVWEAASKAHSVRRVVIATDDSKVLDAARQFGAEAVMTSAGHSNGTSRLAEAASLLELGPEAIVVNVQGDEPEVEPEAIDAAVHALELGELVKTLEAGGVGSVTIGTVATPVAQSEDPRDSNCVKVVMGLDGCALYFSRSLIPFDRDAARAPESRPLRHVGLYVYRRRFLDVYVNLPSTPLERVEQLEQLRALQHGYRIAVAIRPTAGHGIDTPEQYEAFVARWRSAHA